MRNLKSVKRNFSGNAAMLKNVYIYISLSLVVLVSSSAQCRTVSSRDLSMAIEGFLMNQLEPSSDWRCARNFGTQNGPKLSLASQTSSVVNLYVTNINHFLVKFKKIRVVLKQRVVFLENQGLLVKNRHSYRY